jgi:Flp pilus assembly protein TadD
MLNASDTDVLYNIGEALFHLNNQKALKFFDKAISLNSTDPDLYWNKAYILLMWGNYKGAAPAFAKLLSITPNDAAANDDEGISLIELGNHSALKFFDKAIALNKTDANAYYNRGFALQTWGNYTGAISSYNKELALDKALKLKPDSDALYNKKLAVETLFATAR